METLASKIVLITGAGSGIGAATARLFAQHGSRLALIDRNEVTVEKVAEQCRGKGAPKVLPITADVLDEEGLKTVKTKVLEEFSTLHCLVNCACVDVRGSSVNVSMGVIDLMTKYSINTPLLLSQLFHDQLTENKGSIVNVSSIRGAMPMVESVAYDSAKAGMLHLTKCLALDLASGGVRVNSVCPGVILTDLLLTSGMVETKEENDKVFDEIAQNAVCGRPGQAEEVAQSIVFLSSDAASYITGQVLHVSKGDTLAMHLATAIAGDDWRQGKLPTFVQ